MKIGELSERTGASTRSLRYYEQLGLITSERQPNGYRTYDASAIPVVEQIKALLDLGFPTTLIEQVLPCTGVAGPTGDCAQITARVTAIRDDMDEKARRLNDTSAMLTQYLERAATV